MGKKRILLKIGSNTLTKETNQISRGKLEDIGRQISQFIIVAKLNLVRSNRIVLIDYRNDIVLHQNINGVLDVGFGLRILKIGIR